MSEDNVSLSAILTSNDIPSLQGTAFLEKLSGYINDLITNNFDELIYLLYRIDVNEYKLKSLLKENAGADAGKMIATLIIERQVQKIKSRQEHARNKNKSGDDESW